MGVAHTGAGFMLSLRHRGVPRCMLPVKFKAVCLHGAAPGGEICSYHWDFGTTFAIVCERERALFSLLWALGELIHRRDSFHSDIITAVTLLFTWLLHCHFLAAIIWQDLPVQKNLTMLTWAGAELLKRSSTLSSCLCSSQLCSEDWHAAGFLNPISEVQVLLLLLNVTWV